MALIQASVKLTLPGGKVVTKQSPTLLTTNNKVDYFTFKIGRRTYGFNRTNGPTLRNFGYFILNPDLMFPTYVTIFTNVINSYPTIDKTRLDLGSCVIEIGALVLEWQHGQDGQPSGLEPSGEFYYKLISGTAPNKIKITFQDGVTKRDFSFGDEAYYDSDNTYYTMYLKDSNDSIVSPAWISHMATEGASRRVKIEIGTW